jgi:hypothetical protein
VLGTVVRLAPQQAALALTVVDGVPLPPGEDFQGVVRTQDVRATEKDKVKIADCFRAGDVVKGQVVRVLRPRVRALAVLSPGRSRLAMRAITTSPLLATISASSSPRARPVCARHPT